MSDYALYVCTDFEGHYPVGVAAVIIAKDHKQARKLLDEELKARDLPAGKGKISLQDMSEPYAAILCDGNY